LARTAASASLVRLGERFRRGRAYGATFTPRFSDDRDVEPDVFDACYEANVDGERAGLRVCCSL
jgi:hypothetical protein